MKLSRVAAAAFAALVCGCGRDSGAPGESASAADAADAADARAKVRAVTSAEIAKPTPEELDIERRGRDAEARLAALPPDDPGREKLLIEIAELRREAGRANAARLARDAEFAKKLILEQRRGGAK